MLIDLLYRLRRQALRFGAPRRTEVCPPALLSGTAAAAVGWRHGVRSWLSSGWNLSASEPAANPAVTQAGSHAAAVDPRLVRVRDEFLQALDDIRTQQAGMLQGRIRISRSLRGLWHLRPEVFTLVALHFSQGEAQCRLDRLNRHFPTRSPRSGFGLLDAASADARPTRRA